MRAWLSGTGLAGLALVLMASCMTNPVTGKSELMLVSEESEIAMGREAYPALRWQDGGPLQIDAPSQGYLGDVVQRLHAVSHRPLLPVDFTLESASVPNAWAIPGHTAMNRGLLQSLENEAQFAFVMGHEMGHVAARHSATRQTYSLLGSALLGAGALAVGSAGGDGSLGQLALGTAGAGTSLLLLHYDRDQELQADQLGALYMTRAGYDPQEALRAHEVLNRSVDQYLTNIGKRREEPGPVSDLLSTHPRHEIRVSELAAYIQTLPPPTPGRVGVHGDGRFAERWLRQTASIRSLGPAYARYDRARIALAANELGTAERELGEAMRLGTQAQFTTLQGVILARRGRFGDAQQAFARASVQFPGYQPAMHGLGVVEYLEGRDAGAVGYLEESLRLRPGFGASVYLLGLAYARQGRAREAIPHLTAVAQAVPQDPVVNGVLAQQYDRTGDTRAALRAWQAQLHAAPDSDLGRQARERVSALGTSVVESYSNRAVHIRLERPLAWEVTRERSFRQGGEVTLERQDPSVRVWLASTDYGAPPSSDDVRARLDDQIRSRLGHVSVIREYRSFRLGGHPAIAERVLARGLEHLVAAMARGGRVYWVEVSAEPSTWRDANVQNEIQRFLDSLDF